jgi:glutamate-1-semialdehyde 2,1-aminomutase
VMPHEGFLQSLQDLCHEYGALFVLDEVMTGFRVAPGGAQEKWKLDPDITTLGKVIGGGLPVGAYAGKRKIMESVAPAGPMYQAGTLSGNPLAMTAGLVTIRELLKPGVFDSIAERTTQLVRGIEQATADAGVPVQAGHVGSMFGVYFLKEAGQKIDSYESAKAYADTGRYGIFFHALLDRGVYLAPSQFEAGFLSSAHGEQEIEQTIEAVRSVLKN